MERTDWLDKNVIDPNWDEAFADEILGALVLLGITHRQPRRHRNKRRAISRLRQIRRSALGNNNQARRRRRSGGDQPSSHA